MKQLSVKTREIYLNKNQKESLCDTFIYEPSNIEEENLGNLYITGQLNLASDLKDESLSYLVNLLASVIKREYYSNSKRPPLKSLEFAFKKANTALNEFAEKGNTDWMGNLHFISASLSDSTLHLSCTGKAKSILLRNGGLTDIGQTIPTLSSLEIPFKTFTSIASGKVEEGDLIIFSTPTFFEIIGTEQLKLLDSKSSIEEISQKIQEMLSEELNEKKLSLGAIILKIESPKKVSTKNKLQFYEAQTKLIQELPKEKEDRDELSFGERQNAFAGGGLGEKLGKLLFQIFFILGKLLLFAVKYLSKGIRVLGILFYSELIEPTFRGLQKSIFFLAANFLKETKRGIKSLVKIFPLERLHLIFKKLPINRLPSSAKVLLAISVLLAILLGVSLGIIYKKRAFEFNLEQYEGLIQQAYQKETQAEAALIYDDVVRARSLLIEAKELVGTVLSGTDYFKKEAGKLLAQIESQGDCVDKIVRLPEPKLIFDSSESGFIPYQIIGLDNGLYILDKEFSFYRLDLKSFESLKLEINFTNVGHLKDGIALENLIIFYTDTPGIAIFNKDKNTIEPVDTNAWQPPLSQEIKEIDKYYSNIYLLDSGQNQILKSYKILAGFSNPSPWLKEEINLEEVTSVAIDGAIYILKETGEILKYVRGKRVEFKNPEFFNPLKGTTKIFTTPAFKNLYIIDQEGKIVVVLDKNGNLVKQYFSEKFDNLKDIFITDDESKILLLNGNKIYELAI